MNRALPHGSVVRLLPHVWRGEGGRALYGGAPTRMLFLRPAAARLLSGGDLLVDSPAAGRLARLLLDRGFADIAWTPSPWTYDDVTVVVPVKDRTAGLARLLTALPGLRVVVVDDGSADADATAAVAVRRGATVLRHERSRGPAAARNTGLRAVTTPLVAFVDSDVVPAEGWLDPLLVQLADPAVGIAAPRIAALARTAERGRIERYESVRSSLDLGGAPALVTPGGAVSYVPSACLVGRVAALGAGFEESMRVGEDVDLVWRTVRDGWLVRYVPDAVARHEHRIAPGSWLARKAFYGTSAAPLAVRHHGAVAPVVLAPLTVATGLALLTQRRWALGLAAATGAMVTARTARSLHPSTRPWAIALRLAPYGLTASARQWSGAMNRHWWPVVLPAAVVSRRVRRAWLGAAVLDGLVGWARTRPGLDPVTFTVLRRCDDLAYGAGLWWGALRHSTTAPLRPVASGLPSVRSLRRGPAIRAGAHARRWPGTSRRGTGSPPR